MKKSTKTYIATFCILSIPMLTGCSNSDKLSKLHIQKTPSSVELLNTIESKDFNRYSNSVVDFNLGKVTVGEGNELVDIELKGTIGVPKGVTNAPIIFIFSGNNNSSTNEETKEVDSYQGLNYLVDSLSKYGFLAISINTDIVLDDEKRGLIVEDKILSLAFEKHLEYLSKAISGRANNYPISLYKKGDVENIGLIGQSNTGRTIYNVASQQVSKGSSSIKGLLSIAPSSGISVSSYPDIPTSILSTEHSIDTNIAFDMYSDIEKSQNRQSIAHLTYLIGGVADKFNDLVKEEDLINNSASRLTRTPIVMNDDTITDSEKHEEFLSSYSIDFFDFIFNNRLEDSIYSVSNPTARKLYQKDVLSKLYTKNKSIIFDSTLIETATFNSIKSKQVIESSIPSIDSTPNFNEPATNIELNLTQLDWKSVDSSMNININSSNKDFSEYSSLSIEWALNQTNELNINDIDKVSVSLIDSNGNKSEAVLLDELSLNKLSVEPNLSTYNGDNSTTWSRFTPIAETRIPLSLFKDINTKDIKSVSINFKDNNSGSILLKEISLKK